jgi:hypothetical protein
MTSMVSTTPDSLDDWDGDGSGEEFDDGLDETAAGNDSLAMKGEKRRMRMMTLSRPNC